jgi:hypothetical protein
VEAVDNTPLTPLAPSTIEVDERAARRSLREQIARLERQLGQALMDGAVATPPIGRVTRGPRVLTLGELERVRDRLADRLQDVRAELIELAKRQAGARELLERMLLEPGRYRYVRVCNGDLGLPGCTTYMSVPRLGLIGMMMGWWQVKVSSGCPLAT